MAAAIESALQARRFRAGQFSQVLFDHTGRWGIVDFGDCDMSLLIADAEAYDVFVSCYGGIDAIRRRFAVWVHLDALDTNYLTDRPVETFDDDARTLYMNSLAVYRPLFDEVGWPWPFADHIGRDLIGD
jgi:hypothetical protein